MRAAHELTDDQLAGLARSSIEASSADDATKAGLLGEVDRWCDTIPA
jgi:adenosine deaminase